MDALTKAGAIAEEVAQLAQKLINGYKPGMDLQRTPEWARIERGLNEAQGILKTGLEDAAAQAKAKAGEYDAMADQMQAEQEAKLAAAAQPPAPPLLALPFEEKHTPAEPPPEDLVVHLLELAERLAGASGK
jgi:hypothetical protein